jgi:hypothetical protein
MYPEMSLPACRDRQYGYLSPWVYRRVTGTENRWTFSVAWSGSWHHSHIESIFHSCHNSRFKLASSLRSKSYGSWTNEPKIVELKLSKPQVLWSHAERRDQNWLFWTPEPKPVELKNTKRSQWYAFKDLLSMSATRSRTSLHFTSFRSKWPFFSVLSMAGRMTVFSLNHSQLPNSQTHKRLNRKSGVQAGAWTPDFFYLSNNILLCPRALPSAFSW